MWFRWLLSILCGLILLQTLEIEAWSGHVCTKYLVTYLNERYCHNEKYWWWTGKNTCMEWRTLLKSRMYSMQYCCSGWKHNGDQLCIFRTNEMGTTIRTQPDKKRDIQVSRFKREVANCGGNLTAQTRPTQLTSPNYPNDYENNLRCNWTIQASMSYRIAIQIIDIDLQQSYSCSNDYLKINLEDNSGLETNIICSKNYTDSIFISLFNKADTIFVTDGSVAKKGFLLQYQAVLSCGGDLTAYTWPISLHSPNYPYQYANNLYCHWNIEAGKNYTIGMRIIYLDLEENFDCSKDYLQIYLGSNPILETSKICRRNNTNVYLLSSSNKADVFFVTDGSTTKTGFSLEYQGVILVQNCVGNLAAETGRTALTSPNYPTLYENNLRCNWTIQAPMTYKIAIRIIDVDLEESSSCSHDYLKINLGGNKVLETNRICSKNNSDLIFISRSNKADAIFVTDGSVTKKGFLLQYQAVQSCAGGLTAQTWPISLNSPNYPYQYANNLYCLWTIEAEKNYRIGLRISYIDLEETSDCSKDYLQIYLGSNPILETSKICRKNNTDMYFLSMSNEADVIFVTDGSTTKTGFLLEYQGVILVQSCGGNLSAETGTTVLTSPNYPYLYENNLRCNWTIQASMTYRIAIRIIDIDLQQSTSCSLDYLKINLGGNNSLETDRICSKFNTDLIFISRSNIVDVIFVTNRLVAKRGFLLQYQAVPSCGESLTAQTWPTPLNSPNYPYQYPNNLYCQWTIEAEKNHNIGIRINYIDLEENSECSKDYLQIYLGSNPILETSKICRKNNTNLYILSRSNEANVIFVTDGWTNKTGFSLLYLEVILVQSCGGNLSAETGTTVLTSPNYPYLYKNNLRCNWTIEASLGYNIAVRIIDIDLQSFSCSLVYLKINLGGNNSLETDKICSKENTDLIFISKSNIVDVIFVTDGSVAMKGFLLQYQAVPSCGGGITAETWSISLNSPNYPYQYANNLYCLWTIEAGKNYRIAIRITYIDLEEHFECSKDYLQIYLGSSPILETNKICRKNNTDVYFLSRSNEANVIFVTDDSIRMTGFSLEYKKVEFCGMNIAAETEITVLTSPNYPTLYENNLFCNWTIQASMSYRIAIRIIDIDLQQSSSCFFDYLKINLGGNNVLETDKICSKDNTDLIFISRSNIADVIFVTDRSVAKRGFLLQYQAVPSCGGGLTAQTWPTSLNSPNYPYQYPNNLYCIWTIKARKDYTIFISITYIDLEETSDCSKGYLQIYLGSNPIFETSKMCRKINTNVYFLSRSKEADVIFVTDDWRTRRGFSLEYQEVILVQSYGGNLAAETGTTVLTSPNYPYLFGNNECYNWTIKASIGYRIVIRIKDINLQQSSTCSLDYLKINLGGNNTLETDRICRKNKEDLIFISRTNIVDVIFVTDGSLAKRGFLLQYQAVPICGGRLTAQTWPISLNSTNYPYQYANNLYCLWTIEAGKNYRIAINISYIDLEETSECSKDYLQIYLGRNPILETSKICRKNYANVYFLSRSNEADVIFVTDGSTTKTGFLLEYQGVTLVQSCGGNLAAQSWTTALTSPNYPYWYESNLRCNWTIQAPINSRIVIRIIDIDLEQSSPCSFDYLKINLGCNIYDIYWEAYRICSKDDTDMIFDLMSNKADVIFVKNSLDESVAKRGFLLQYQAVPICGGRLIAQTWSMSLNSPNYPYQYANNLYCLWTIEAWKDYKIAIRITYMDLEENSECSKDYLEIYLGKTPILETSKICRKNYTNVYFLSKSNKAAVIFVTDVSTTKTGFSLQYQRVSLDKRCIGNLIAQTRITTLTSPNYPYLYENNLRCNWTLEAPVNSRIAVRITDMDLEQSANCSSDYLKINTGGNNVSENNKICSSNNTDLIFFSSSNKANVIFVTNGSGTNRGFTLQYQAGNWSCDDGTGDMNCHVDWDTPTKNSTDLRIIVCENQEKTDTSMAVTLIISLGPSVVVLSITIGIYCYCYRRKKQAERNLQRSGQDVMDDDNPTIDTIDRVIDEVEIEQNVDTEPREIQWILQRTIEDILSEMNSRLNDSEYKTLYIKRSCVWKSALRQFRQRSFRPDDVFHVKFVDDQGNEEGALDAGGPKREYFQLMMDHLADCSLFEGPSGRKLLSYDVQANRRNEYFYAGMVIGQSMLFKGPVPRFLSPLLLDCLILGPENVRGSLEDIHDSDYQQLLNEGQTTDCIRNFVSSHNRTLHFAGCLRNESMENRDQLIQDLINYYLVERTRPAFEKFKRGLQSVGVYDYILRYPNQFRKLFSRHETLTAVTMSALFTITYTYMYSQEYEDREEIERKTVEFWETYLSIVETGGSQIHLEDIMMFATGMKEPADGQTLTIGFLHPNNGNPASKYPTSSTCSRTLYLPLHDTFEEFKEAMDFGILNCSQFGLV